jgi:hypothetical protein
MNPATQKAIDVLRGACSTVGFKDYTTIVDLGVWLINGRS